MQGRLDGENAIKSGEGYMFKKINEWNDCKKLQAEYPQVGTYIHAQVKDVAEYWKQKRMHDPCDVTDWDGEIDYMMPHKYADPEEGPFLQQ